MLRLTVLAVSILAVSASPLALVVEDTAALERQLEDLAVVLESQGKEDALEYASFQLSGGGWNNVKVSSELDLAEKKQISGEDLRKRLAAIIAATKKEETQKHLAELQESNGSFTTSDVLGPQGEKAENADAQNTKVSFQKNANSASTTGPETPNDATEANADYFYSYDTDTQTTQKPPVFGFLGVTINEEQNRNAEQPTKGVAFKLINTRTGDETTTVQDTTTTEQETTTTEVATTTEQITTTELPEEDKSKEGSVELLVTSITAGGSSIQWSHAQQVLYIADMWGGKVLRFNEIDEEITTTIATTTEEVTTVEDTTTTTAAETTTNAANFRDATTTEAVTTVTDADTTVTEADTTVTEADGTTVTDEPTTTDTPTTTQTPTTTEAPLPYEIRTFVLDEQMIKQSDPQGRSDVGMYSVAVPVNDLENPGKNRFMFGYNNVLRIVEFHLWDNFTSKLSNEEYRFSPVGGIETKNYQKPTAAWIDPRGNALLASVDLRPFEPRLCNSILTVLPRSFDNQQPIHNFACEPSGMAWPSTNDTMYMADAVTKKITRFDYTISRYSVDMTNPTTLVDFNTWDVKGSPKGIVTDTNDHLWVSLAQEESSIIVEIDPKDLTKGPISTIEIPDPTIVSLAFGGEERDRLYVLTEKDLYKVTDLGVIGNRVAEFVYFEE